MKTNEKWSLFVDEYMANGWNGTAAYMKIYGTNTKIAAARSSLLLTNVKIKALIEQKQEELRKTYQITKEQLLNDLIDIKNANKSANPSVALKAAEQISKLLGYNEADKIETTQKTIKVIVRDEEPNILND